MVLDNKICNHLREKTDTYIDFSILIDKRFLFVALIPVGLHMFWNSTLLADYGLLKHLALGVVAWFVVLRLVLAGLNQIKREKSSL
jgi:RsiW-degrading membrane proteinase PrsW (M82 family)